MSRSPEAKLRRLEKEREQGHSAGARDAGCYYSAETPNPYLGDSAMASLTDAMKGGG